MRSRLLFLAALILPATARAWYMESSASHTRGPDDYDATSGAVELGQDEGFLMRPGFSTYHSLGTDPSHTVSLRLGWFNDSLSLGCDGSVTPPANDYKSHSLGCDGTYSINLDDRGTDDEGNASGPAPLLSRVDLGGSFLYTDHKETAEQIIRFRKRVVGVNTIIRDTGQYDMTGSLGTKVLDFELGGDITFSKYDKHIITDEIPALAAAVTRGANPAVYGFQDWKGKARLSWTRFPVLQPFAEWSYTKYKMVAQYPQKVYTAGLTTVLGPVTVKGSWDLNLRGGGDKRSYFTLGATWRY
ncbi:MAG: hypothetical protein HY924_13220 [Elusimicrobia bacterium]|nr:hypothetical protein [Elusimicrobiota bacterium]